MQHSAADSDVYCFALSTDIMNSLTINITIHYKSNNNKNYTVTRKWNARNDQSSLGFRVAHCHVQLTGLDLTHNRLDHSSRIIISISRTLDIFTAVNYHLMCPSPFPLWPRSLVVVHWGSKSGSCRFESNRGQRDIFLLLDSLIIFSVF